jgi:hypothetical protein
MGQRDKPCIFGIARSIENLEARPQFQRGIGELPPVQAAGHNDIGKEKIDIFYPLDDLVGLGS